MTVSQELSLAEVNAAIDAEQDRERRALALLNRTPHPFLPTCPCYACQDEQADREYMAKKERSLLDWRYDLDGQWAMGGDDD